MDDQLQQIGEMGALAAIAILVIGFFAYFLPAVIAFVRGHHQWVAISALNLLLGWTALGWIAAFIWSLTAKRQEPRPSAADEGRKAFEAAAADEARKARLRIG